MVLTRRPRILPFSSSASSAWVTWSRPCASVRNASVRSRRPLHRTADLLGRPEAHGLLGIDEDLRAEAAADVGRDHAQLVLGRDADEGRQHEPRDVRVLARGVEREAVRARSRSRRSPRAARSAFGIRRLLTRSSLVTCLAPGRRRVGRRLVAEVPVEDRVVGRDRRGSAAPGRCAVARVDDGRQHLVVDDDRFGRVPGLRQRLGDHHRDVVADIAHLALRQRRMRAGLHRRAVLGVDHPAADQTADLVGGEIVAGEHGEDARHRQRRRRVDRSDVACACGERTKWRRSAPGG